MLGSVRFHGLCPHIVLVATDGDTSTAEGFFGTATHSYIVDQVLPLGTLGCAKSGVSGTGYRPALQI